MIDLIGGWGVAGGGLEPGLKPKMKMKEFSQIFLQKSTFLLRVVTICAHRQLVLSPIGKVFS